jgi:HEAT repeat protein
VRQKLIAALGASGGSVASAALEQLLRDTSIEVRIAAVEALGYLKDEHGPALLLEATRDSEAHVREVAARVLGELAYRSGLANLVDLLRDSSRDVRLEAIRAIGRLGDRRAMKSLRLCLRDIDREIRVTAAKALHDMGVSDVLTIIKGDDSDFVRLAKIGDTAGLDQLIRTLVNALQNGGTAGVAAARRLIDLGERERVAPLLTQLSLTSRSDAVRKLAVAVLLRMGVSGIVDRLMVSSTIGAPQDVVMWLIRLGEEQAIPALVAYLNRSGRLDTAEAYLNCGHPELAEKAKAWATVRGYSIATRPGRPVVSWGGARERW